MPLSKIQKLQLESQLRQHNHNNYEVDLVLTSDYTLKNFSVHAKVLRPEKVTAIYLARWLFFNNGLFLGKTVIDMGSGTGIQGMICGLYGAQKVIFSDLSRVAVINTKENIRNFNLTRKAIAVEGDLFENIKERADVIVFNHPFFHDSTIENLLAPETIVSSMLSRGKLIHRFFKDAKRFLKKDGRIIMPYFHLAGPINDPAKQAPKHGYGVTERFRVEVKSGLQKGTVSIYEISLH